MRVHTNRHVAPAGVTPRQPKSAGIILLAGATAAVAMLLAAAGCASTGSTGQVTNTAGQQASVVQMRQTDRTGTYQANILDFGAVGDATTDDSMAIQAAIDALPLGAKHLKGASTGGVVVVPRGRFRITMTIRLRRGVRIVGEGREASQILADLRGTALLFEDAGGYLPDQVGIEHLSIWQSDPGGQHSGAAIEIRTGTALAGSPIAVQINDVIVDGAHDGIAIENAIVADIRNTIATKCVRHGILVRYDPANDRRAPSVAVSIETSYASQNGGDGFRIEQAGYSRIASCASDTNGRFGYALEGGGGAAIVGSGAEGNGRAQLGLRQVSNVAVSGAWFNSHLVPGFGMELDQATNVGLLGVRLHSSRGDNGPAIHSIGTGNSVTLMGTTFSGEWAAAGRQWEGPEDGALRLDGGNGSRLRGGMRTGWLLGNAISPEPATTFGIVGEANYGAETGLMVDQTFRPGRSGKAAGITVRARTTQSSSEWAKLYALEARALEPSGNAVVARAAGAYIADQRAARDANAGVAIGPDGGFIPLGHWSIANFSKMPSLFAAPVRMGGVAGPLIQVGIGSPEGVVTAPVGSLFLRTDGGPGTTLYVKESGVDAQGWAPK